MKRLALGFLLAVAAHAGIAAISQSLPFPGPGGVAGGVGGYSFHRSITIDHTQVGSTDSTNFPVLVASATSTYRKTVANGGNLQNSSAFDDVFTSDAGCTTKLNWEIALSPTSVGQSAYFVQVGTVSHTVDTVFYECYGNASITTNQSNKTGTWDATFGNVWHLQEAAHPYNDSTSNAKNSTSGTDPTQVSGLFGNAQSFVAASAQSITFSTITPPPGLANAWTISGWIKVPSTAHYGIITSARTSGGTALEISLYVKITNGFGNFENDPTGPFFAGSTNLADNAWHFLAANSAGIFYVDGAQISTGGSVIVMSGSGPFDLGAAISGSSIFSTCTMQEVHNDSVNRSADWILAEYNNQKSGSTMLTISAPL